MYIVYRNPLQEGNRRGCLPRLGYEHFIIANRGGGEVNVDLPILSFNDFLIDVERYLVACRDDEQLA